MTNDQPNKSDGEDNGGPTPVEERGAVRNQDQTTPDDYPDGSNGKPGQDIAGR